MKKITTIAAAVAATLGCGVASAAFNGHPASGVNYYEIDVQPMTTVNPSTGANIVAYNLLPFIPLPPPPVLIADPFMINGYIIQAANDQAAAGVFGAWVSGQMPLSQLQQMAKGTIHSECTDIGGAFAVSGNPYPALLFKSTDNPQEQPNLVSLCHEVANFNAEQLVMAGVSNKPAWEGNWASCWNEGPQPVPTELAVTGGTGVFQKARGELLVSAVKIVDQNGQCQRPGPVKRLKWTLHTQ